MDHPYEATRQDQRGTVSRACFRYLGDAQMFVTAQLKNEVNPCLWRVKNLETGRLCGRWRYRAGVGTREV